MGKQDFKFGRERQNNSENEFYAFVHSVEQNEIGRIEILFDSIEIWQVYELFGKNPNYDEFESLKPRMIKCDFSLSTYDSFSKMIEKNAESIVEGSWLILTLTDNPTKYKAEYILEYFIDETPTPILIYINENSKKADFETQASLEKLFKIKSKGDDLIKLERRLKLQEMMLFDKSCLVPKDVAVYNVGQGNMNAILNNAEIPIAYFDVGGGAYWNAKTYQNPLRLCFTQRPLILLSHWDYDHWWTFNLLIRRKIIDPKVKTIWIVPFQKFGAIQYKFYNLLLKHGHKIVVFPMNGVKHFHFGFIEKCQGSTINDSGLIIKVSINQKNFLLPADCSYDWIPNLQNLAFDGIVASHHGGHCSTNQAHYPKPTNGVGRIVYSFGFKNSYHHPNGISVIEHVKVGWKEIRTTLNGSVSFLSSSTRNAPCVNQCDLHIVQVF